MRVWAVTSPTPGTEVSRLSAARQIGDRLTLSSMSRSSSASWSVRVFNVVGACAECGDRVQMEPIGLHANHLHHLTAASDQLRQGLAVGVSERTCVRPDAFGEQSNDLGVERVGFGEPPSGTGEIPDRRGLTTAIGRWALARAAATVTRTRRWPQARSGRGPIGAAHGPTAQGRCCRAGLRSIDLTAAREHRDDPSRHRCDEARRSGEAFYDPSLRMRARLAAQATVRVPYGTGGRGTLLFLGFTHPGGLRAPVHR